MSRLRYLSLFSGIGGFDLGFDRAGMTCAGQVEYDEKARGVLARHWPDTPRLSDVREVQGNEFGTIDVICGGFPCQDVSVAGRRAGLAGERSGLWFEFHRLIDRVKPRTVVIENVPGLLSSNGGRDFAVILRGLVECGYGVVWRILDAQYFGVAQRRRRVFIVGSLGDGRAAEILFEREGGGGHIAEGRSTRKGIATDVAASLKHGGGKGSGGINTTMLAAPLVARQAKGGFTDPVSDNMIPVAATLNSGGNNGGFRTEPGDHLVAIPLRAEGHDASEDGTGRQNLVMALHYSHDFNQDRIYDPAGIAPAHTASDSNQARNIATTAGVRRLTPTECERLQGFPDGWTAGQGDSARYRQLGNAVAVPVAEWLGRRIIEATP